MDGEDGRPPTPNGQDLLEEPNKPSFHLFSSSLSPPSTTVDPWLPLSSSSQTQHLQQDDSSSIGFSSSVHQWLQESVNSSSTVTTGGDSGFGQDTQDPLEFQDDFHQGQGAPFTDSDMTPPATSSVGGSGSNSGGASSKGQKDKGETLCQHIVKAQSLPGLRKAFKGDIRIVCSKDNCEDIDAKQWMCLQCGNVGCGRDGGALGGHAKLHVKTPRSDCHAVAVRLDGNLEKAWCFECEMDIDANEPFLKESMQFIRRNQKTKSALAKSSGQSIPPIVLGPPPPPPVPKIEPPKQFTAKGKQNNNNRMTSASSSNNSYNNRWDRDSGGVEWPLGLDNLGNTCFMNSALQCLSRTRSLLDKLDLHGSGNRIEILVSPEDPCVQLVNPRVEEDDNDDTSEFSSDFERRSLVNHHNEGGDGVESSSQQSTSADSSEGGSGEISPSTEIDSLLDAASSRSSRKSESEGCGDAEKQLLKKELEQELAKPLRLRLVIPKDSMTTKLRHCFKAVTRSSDTSPDNEGSRNMYSRPVYSPRGIQHAVSKHFRLGHQHDSHELLRSVVDMMKRDQIRSFRLAIMQRYGVKRNEGRNCDPRLTELLKMWDRKLYHKTFVDEIFGGELVTFQECLQCGNVRRSHEEFLDLSLPIRVFRANPNPSTKKTYSLFDDDHDYVINRSVEECLRAYTEPEFLTGSNVVECEKCHRMNLEKLANGTSFDEVFPNVKLESQTNSDSGKGQSKHQQKKGGKCKRQNRQAKMKAKQQHQADYEDPQENSEHTTTDGLNLVEDHFRNDQSLQSKPKCAGVHGGVPEDDSKSSKSGSLDDYVVVQNASTLNDQNGPQQPKQKNVDHDDMDYDTPSETGQVTTEQEGLPLSRGLSSSIKSLTLIENGMDVEEQEGCLLHPEDENMDHNNDNFDEDMDDLNEPAVDGIGNASDIDEDDDESNCPARLDLGLEDKPISVAEYLAVPTVGTGVGSGGTPADEGFGSEGENSSEEKPSQSLSGRSSSHNSISETDNLGTGDATASASGGVREKPAKKIPITKCPCSRRQLISRAPECLTLHLKRFQHTARGSSKLSDRVTFPYILNLTGFCSEAEEDVNKPGFKTTFDEDGEVVYSLYGIVEHSGSLHFGHYVAYVKVAGKPTTAILDDDVESNNKTAEDAWFYISDSHVSRTTLKQVLVQDAYILFYERIRGPEKRERLDALRSIEVERGDFWKQSSSALPYSYGKANPVVTTGSDSTTPNWDTEDKWEDSSSHQVSSTNNGDGNEDMSMTLNYEISDPVSSSTLYSSSTQHLLGGGIVIDGVSSSTDAECMDYSALPSEAASSSSHPLWNDEAIRGGSAFFGDIMEDEGDDTANTSNPVSSSSDVTINPRSEGYEPLEEAQEVD